MELPAGFWLQVITTLCSAVGVVWTMGAKINWIDRKLTHHINNDEQNFKYYQQRVDALERGKQDRHGGKAA